MVRVKKVRGARLGSVTSKKTDEHRHEVIDANERYAKVLGLG